MIFVLKCLGDFKIQFLSIILVGLLDFNYIDQLSTILNIEVVDSWIQYKAFRCIDFSNGILAKLEKRRSGYTINCCKGIYNISSAIPERSFRCNDIFSCCNLIGYPFKILLFVDWSIKCTVFSFACFNISKHFSILLNIYLPLLGCIVKIHEDLGCCTIHIDWNFLVA